MPADDPQDFRPEWSRPWTRAEAEKALGAGFVFRGAGWYDYPASHSMLVVPLYDRREGPRGWKGEWPESQVFMFSRYALSGTVARAALASAAGAPLVSESADYWPRNDGRGY